MAAGRTRLTFKTPIRKQKTPAKQLGKQKNKKENETNTKSKNVKVDNKQVTMSQTPLETINTKNTDSQTVKQYVAILEATRKKEQDLITNYISENQFLKTINPGHIYTKFTGLEIKEVKDKLFEFSWRIDVKKLVFRLEEEERDYSYEYVNSENVNLPEALMGCINFDKAQYMKFYFNMLEIMLAKSC